MKRVEVQIPDGDAGIDATVGAMWRLIRRDVNDPLTTKIVKKLKADNCKTTCKNIYDYVNRNFSYKDDPEGVELVTAPVHMLSGKVKKGDCDDLTTVLVCLLGNAGVPVRIKVIAWRLNDFTHVIAEYNCEGTWLPLDPVRGSGGWENTIEDSKIKRTKVYTDSTMSRPLVTLEDGLIQKPCCGGNRGRGGFVNKNIINIGNTDNGRFTSGIPNGNNYVSQIAPPPPPKPELQIEKVPTPIYLERPIPTPVPVPVTKTIETPTNTTEIPGYITYKEFY